MNGFVLGLGLKKGLKATRKWAIEIRIYVYSTFISTHVLLGRTRTRQRFLVKLGGQMVRPIVCNLKQITSYGGLLRYGNNVMISERQLSWIRHLEFP